MSEISIRLERDTALILLGWIQAHRTQGEWDPRFLTEAIDVIANAAAEDVKE